MVANYTRLFKLIFVIIIFFIVLLLLSWNNFSYSNGNGIRQGRKIFIDELLVDKRTEPTLEQRLKLIKEEMPAFPLEEMLARPGNAWANKCGPGPDFNSLEFHNDYWQVARKENVTYFIFAAYYDDREMMKEAPVVRLLTMINLYGKRDEVKHPSTYCQFWYKNRAEPRIVNVTDHKIIWIFGGAPNRVFPTLMSCELPEPEDNEEQEVPQMVSLVANRCDQAKNLLRVVNERRPETEGQPNELNDNAIRTDSPQKPHKKKKGKAAHLLHKAKKPLRFMICVKAMDFPYVDMSWRMVEWLELVRMLGADKVVFYDAQMHPNMTLVLNDYMKTNPEFVELRAMSMGRGEPHSKPHFHHYAMAADGFNRILNEMIPYNDCFYRNMYNYDYIGVFDIDEVIMPLGNVTNWSDLIDLAYKVPDYEREKDVCDDWASFCFRNVYFPRYPERPKVYRKLPSYYYMLQHVERVVEHCDRYSATKCLHSTRYVIGLHNHFPIFRAQNGECEPKSVPVQYAQLQHYREPDNLTRLINPMIDDNIWRFQPELQQRVYAKYEKLGFLPNVQDVLAAENKRKQNDEQQLREAIAIQ